MRGHKYGVLPPSYPFKSPEIAPAVASPPHPPRCYKYKYKHNYIFRYKYKYYKYIYRYTYTYTYTIIHTHILIQNVARVQNCPEITILDTPFGKGLGHGLYGWYFYQVSKMFKRVFQCIPDVFYASNISDIFNIS